MDLDVCGPVGRGCIERNSIKSFNCSRTCEGIYADVRFGGKIEEEDEGAMEAVATEFKGKVDADLIVLLDKLVYLEKEMKLVKGIIGKRGQALDEEKYKMLVAEYRKFKTNNVKHFRFNSAANLSTFGES